MQNSELPPLSKDHWVSLAITVTTTLVALIAFAANSVLCRLALASSNIDPASFTAVRLLSGAITLAIIVLFTRKNRRQLISSFSQFRQLSAYWGPLMLTSYAVFFSFAYVRLNTATGALILFATVQFSMLLVNRLKGSRLSRLEWLGLIISFAGFLLLIFPKASQPSWPGLLMMIIAGIAWAFYTLAGTSSKQPIISTAQNFLISIPIVSLVLLLFIRTSHWNEVGLLLAITSGSLASGIGYALWYSALRHISISTAAVSQLSVPLIAALGGIIFVDETLSNELILSGILILMGIALVVLKNPTARKQKPRLNDVD
jgi:drug/metabolite transporter (DMT)-like permease